ncbi:ATP-dependent DNA/RNA helicase DHX36 [Manduca sexta]|uniref:RNA helicase n=1 Tax=Manduca sexta TaxID=7130 RepID=A0A921YPV4_MANSE|nr:ATP-dependent DNA/RNA helicase DHX36 [Manduca sexta]KAG6443234.1 hypothetical protein O3G_MSEX002785 [Manduca sexta]
MPPKRPYGRPPGLRGKDIGLYYKSRQLQKKNTENRYTINLKIPPNVVSSIQNNLASIKRIANELNIPIKPMKTLDLCETPGNETSPDAINSSQHDLKSTDMKPPETYTRASKKSKDEPTNNSKSKQMPTSSYDFVPNNEKNRDSIATRIAKSVNRQSENFDSHNQRLGLGLKAFKYGYDDIITGNFDEKLDECLARGNVSLKYDMDHSLAIYEDYKNMLSREGYKKLLKFREILPTYKKSAKLLEVIKNNQVVVISGETGCGKSTQVPQIILDDAINNKIGSTVKILVTQPRRIAASSLAKRVSEERGERMGNTVGFAVRLEKIDPRPVGSILFCTTGILLTELEVDQGLGSFSHIILDEVHERDTHIDLALCMLKKVLSKRKDVRLILMSATIDAEKLSEYYDNCPMVHIEGLAYPVKDIYLEEILQITNYELPIDVKNSQYQNPSKPWQKHVKKFKLEAANAIEKDVKYRAEISKWLESKRKSLPRHVYHSLQNPKIEDLNIDLVYEVVRHICIGEPGAILVFLPGIGDITKLLKKMSESKKFPPSAYEIYPLHSKLPSLEQHKIFERPLPHVRKIIVATNIAETSITVDDIVYVVDCGKIKYNGFNIEENVTTLKTEWVSKANLRQRRGRAGRCQPGICYHLVSSYRAETLEELLKPEIQRCDLLEAVLAVKRLRLGKAEEALNSMPAPPAASTIQSAVKHLQKCGALDEHETLTPLGWHLARLPVHPSAGKLLVLGALFGCLDRAASVAAVWGFKDPFQLVIGKEKEVDEARRCFAQGEPSDHIAVSEAIINWEMCSYKGRNNFAYDNFLSKSTLEMLTEMKKQLGENLKQMGFLNSGNIKSQWENRNSENFSLFKAIVAASLYPNIATVKWLNINTYNRHKPIRIKVHTPEDGLIEIHPSSVLGVVTGRNSTRENTLCVKPGANWLVYWLKQKSTKLYLFDVTLVYTLPLLFFGELKVTKDEESDDYFISISKIRVRCKKETTQLLFEVRSLLDQVLASKIMVSSQHCSSRNTRFEEQVLNTVTELITAEDERAEYLGDDEDLSESEYSEDESERSWCK